jgi:probable phosphoglycerate mutase
VVVPYPLQPRPGKRVAQSRTLFSSTTPAEHVIAHIDGGARGNPGPAGYGVVITDAAGEKLAELSKYLGTATNNHAEYAGLIAALDYALANGHKALRVLSDSELLVRQMQGRYKVRSPELRELYDRVRALRGRLAWFDIEHVRREQNREADRLANLAMDHGSGRPAPRELRGVVRGGKVELQDGDLPDGTPVRVRVER